MTDIDDIFGRVLKVEDASDYLRQIQEVLNAIHKTNETLSIRMKQIFDNNYFDMLTSYLGSREINIDDSVAIRELLTKVQSRVMSLPIMTISIAFDPRSVFVDGLVDKMTESKLGAHKLKIVQDESIVAGMVLEWMGSVEDYSLGKELSDEAIIKSI